MKRARFISILVGAGTALYKRAAFVTLVLVILQLITFQITSQAQQDDRDRRDQAAAQRDQALLENALAQNRRLTEQLQEYAKQDRAYDLCFYSLFAKYTRDHVPLSDLNLDSCTTGSPNTQSVVAPITTPPQQATPQPVKPPATRPTTSSEPPEPGVLKRLGDAAVKTTIGLLTFVVGVAT